MKRSRLTLQAKTSQGFTTASPNSGKLRQITAVEQEVAQGVSAQVGQKGGGLRSGAVRKAYREPHVGKAPARAQDQRRRGTPSCIGLDASNNAPVNEQIAGIKELVGVPFGKLVVSSFAQLHLGTDVACLAAGG